MVAAFCHSFGLLVAATAFVAPIESRLYIGGRALFRCPDTNRCGVFSVSMHKIVAETKECKEYCVMFPILKASLRCGGCTQPTNTPTKSPTMTTPTNNSTDARITVSPAARAVPARSPVLSPKAPASVATAAPIPSLRTVTKAPVRSLPVRAPVAAGAYNIQLQLVGIPAADQAFFASAKSRWESVITGDLSDAPSTGLESIGSGCQYPSIIDDLYICASYRAIDGAKNIVGLAGPYYNRVSDLTPFVGGMEFDSADIAFLASSGSLVDTVLHEMGHVLGVGTNWDDKGIAGPKSSQCPYNGVNANREHEAVSGCRTTPTEQIAAKGACSHWSDECLVDELMTGLLVAGSPALLSRITVGSLADLGYKVDYSRADPYTKANLGPGCTCSTRRTAKSMMEMSHGETLQLGLRSRQPGVQRRRLSQEAHQSALEFGRTVLAERALSKPDRKLLASDTVYVGDQVVSVLIREGENIYGVVVRTEE